jgi:signal transduction histidine kinase
MTEKLECTDQERLAKRLGREQRARAESEILAEKALRELYNHRKDIQLLQRIAVVANQASSIDEALQVALDQVCLHTRWPVGHVFMLSETDDRTLEPTTLWHVDNKERFKKFCEVSQDLRFGPGVGLPGRVLESAQPLWIIDVTKDSNFPRAKAATDIGVRAAFGFPVLIGKEVVAVLEFFSDLPMEPDEALLEVMANVGTQLGRVIERIRAQAVLQKNNFQLEQALAENRALCEDLKHKQCQLEIASKHKSQFLANMSHELRTPLNAILGYTQLIMNKIYGDVPDKIKEPLSRVDVSGRHLLDLINDVLDLSKIEAGRLKLSLQPYLMKDVIHEVVTGMESLASRKQLAFTWRIPDNLPTAIGDARRIKQVLLNLIGNAIKFTDSGEVAVHVALDQSHLKVSVSDTGPGISAADQTKIFNEFQQADSSATREKGGTGLGLAIVKRIIELHGGTVGVESTLGHGSVFWITLPTSIEQQVGGP